MANPDVATTEFDLDAARKAAFHYSTSTQVECHVIDTTGQSLYIAHAQTAACRLCRRVQATDGGAFSCAKAHLYGSYQAERFGGAYVFFCSLGLAHWAAPISRQGRMVGALVGGPVLMMEPEEFLIDEFLKENGLDTEKDPELQKALREIPVLNPSSVTSLSELLFMVARHLSFSGKQDAMMDRQVSSGLQQELSGVLHRIKSLSEGGHFEDVYPFRTEKQLLAAIASGDVPRARELLNDILGYVFFSSGGRFEIIKARVLELVVLLSRAAMEGGADAEQIFGLNYHYLEEIHRQTSLEELTLWLSRILQRFSDCVFNLSEVKHVDVIHKAIDFVKRNYTQKITLEDVAGQVYLSPSYFSKVFKAEMKSNFNTYLHKIRTDVARKLLLDESIPLIEISSMVGYDDQSYFSKVFKKMTGVSPGRYRESRGRASGG